MPAITPGTVIAGPNAKVRSYRSAAATGGQAIYRDGGKMALCDADAEESAYCDGVAVSSCADDGFISYVYEGQVIFTGSPLTPGMWYAISTTLGGIGPLSDLAAGDYATLVGLALDANTLDVQPRHARVPIGS
jgi:hypothetical protein